MGIVEIGKTVLTKLASFNRVIHLPAAEKTANEGELLIELIRKAYTERIGCDNVVTLQLKDEQWGGVFVDFFDDVVPDRAVFKVIVEKSEVACLCALGLGQCIRDLLCL